MSLKSPTAFACAVGGFQPSGKTPAYDDPPARVWHICLIVLAPLTSTFLQRVRPRGSFATGSRTSAQITGWCISPVLNQGTESRPLWDSVQVARRRRDTMPRFPSPRYYLLLAVRNGRLVCHVPRGSKKETGPEFAVPVSQILPSIRNGIDQSALLPP